MTEITFRDFPTRTEPGPWRVEEQWLEPTSLWAYVVVNHSVGRSKTIAATQTREDADLVAGLLNQRESQQRYG